MRIYWRPTVSPTIRLWADRCCRTSSAIFSSAVLQVYFITNGQPRRFWDFVRTVLTAAGCVAPTKTISTRVAYSFASAMETLNWALSPVVSFRPTITRHLVCTLSGHHWFSHAKASACICNIFSYLH